jgi:hypothetical protein
MVPFDVDGGHSGSEGYFTFRGIVCYGRCDGAQPAQHADASLPESSHLVTSRNGRVHLPFDPGAILKNLREERYQQQASGLVERCTSSRAARLAYYALRPVLPVGVRKHLQQLRLRGWKEIRFPQWPVDTSVDRLALELVRVILEQGNVETLPLIWFWPDGAAACVAMTHDIEGTDGRRLAERVMDLDEAYGVPSAFQLVPGPESTTLASRLRARAFEVNVHDLRHDGSLFAEPESFPAKAAEINRYARELGARGFRSGAMYRKQEWYGAFDFSYDMSVPNAAHLEPQRGGCCTVMPYFVGDVLELPLTTTQDYSLFHIIGDYSTRIWREEMEQVLASHGFLSFIVHPDYLTERRAEDVYVQLLSELSQLRTDRNVWIAAPGDIDAWWRSRAEMRLVNEDGQWRIAGDTTGRARVAYAELRDGQVVYRIDPAREPGR